MLQELWTEHRKAFLFAIGMACFLAAGLLGRCLPNSPENKNPRENQISRESPQAVIAAGAPAAIEEPAGARPEPYTVRRSAGAVSGVSVMPLAPEPEPADEGWVMYITGAVRKPGVYRLPAGTRLFRLVQEAGGLSDSADPVAVNLASMLADGMHIHVPDREKSAYAPPASGYEEPQRPQQRPASRAAANNAARGKIGVKIDINRASPEELTALKGIGPVLAGNIAAYRQKNGYFRSAEDLLQVKGIGEKKLEGFRDFITVGR